MGWREHQLLVMSKLDDLGESIKELKTSFDAFKSETGNQLAKIKQSAAVHKARSTIFGTLGGSAVILLNTIVEWALKNHK